MPTVFDAYQHVVGLVLKVTYVVDDPPKTGNHKELPLESARNLSVDPRAGSGIRMTDRPIPISSRHFPTNSDLSRYDSVVDEP